MIEQHLKMNELAVQFARRTLMTAMEVARGGRHRFVDIAPLSSRLIGLNTNEQCSQFHLDIPNLHENISQ
jgi:hypothetical protein